MIATYFRTQFEKIFEEHRAPNEDTVTITDGSDVCHFAVHRLHPELSICFLMDDSEDFTYEIWIFGSGPRAWRRYEKLASNEDCSRMDIWYKIGCGINRKGELYLYDKTSIDQRSWNDELWLAQAFTAKTELCRELARMLHEKVDALVQAAAADRAARTPPPEERYQPQPIEPQEGVLVITVGEYPTGVTNYNLAGGKIFDQGLIEFMHTDIGILDPRIPLHKDVVNKVGVSGANFLYGLSEIGGIQGMFLVPAGGISVMPERGEKLDHQKIGQLLAQSYGLSKFRLINRLTGQELS